MKSKNYERYLQTYNGRELLKKHELNEYGIWRIEGEDPNCDLGGSHHTPFLGNVAGSLADVIVAAAEMPNFWQWGGGGTITKIVIMDTSKAERIRELESAIDNLQAQLKKLKEE